MLQDDLDDDDKNSKQKRGVLPKQATQVMKSWLFQHIVVRCSHLQIVVNNKENICSCCLSPYLY